MRNVELLSPVGKIESAYAAIANGADAIYLGGMKFGARSFADNFEIEALETVVKFAHNYHVRVFVTLNTLLYDDELSDCLKYVKELYEINVDALIVQDLGLLYLLRMNFPDFEIHSSTQMHIFNAESLYFLKSQGVKRAVLARECSLEKIQSFRHIDIEKEVFVHGALCISYSGQCLFSSFNNNRSGNRGKCAQGCRMPYELFSEDKLIAKEAYLLSPKDLNVLEQVDDLMEAGVHSFKIEGRMKTSEYVAYTTYLYRQAIDHTNFKVNENELEQLKVLFNRQYTKGHLYQQLGPELMNHYRPNHLGVTLGKVIASTRDKIKVKLSANLHQFDGVRVIQKEDVGFIINRIYKNGLLVNSAGKNEIVELDCKKYIEVGSNVVKTKDYLWEKQVQTTYLQNKRKVSLYASVSIVVDKPLCIKIWDDYGNELEECSSEVVEAAKNRPISDEEIQSKLNKTKDTIYEFRNIEMKAHPDVFIPIKVINELRRSALIRFEELVQNSFKREEILLELEPIKPQTQTSTKLNVSVLNEEQLNICLKQGIDSIYVEDYKLYEKYKQNQKIKYVTSNVYDKSYDEASMISDIGGLNKGKHVNNTLNICNSYAVEYLNRLDNGSLCLSLEMSDEQIRTLLKHYENRNGICSNLELMLYGKVKLMSSMYCVVNHMVLNNQKQNCQLCKRKAFYLKDTFNNQFYMRGDEECTMHMYHHEPINKIDQMSDYVNLNIKTFRLCFTDEKEEEIVKILQKFQKNDQSCHFD